MKQFTPKLFDVLKTSYSKEQLFKDIIAGIIVAIIALPLSIALALASGVRPEQGIYTAIFAGFVISFLGGSRVQIAGPTAAFATIVAGIVAKNGMSGLVTATILAGIILIIMGIFKFGNLIRFIPYTITTGFTIGIAVTIFVGQIKDFLGLTFTTSPIETIDKVKAVAASIGTFNYQALIVGMVSLLILIFLPKIKIFSKIPPSLIAVIVAVVMVKILKMDVKTIGDLYTISSAFPKPALPDLSYSAIVEQIPNAFTIAILAGIESLLSCVVSDGMIGSRHNSNMELVAQGAGNIASALFGGIPATGAIARTAANIKNGGRTPIAGMVHAVVLLLILVSLMPLAKLIPMPAIAAILFMVAYNMSGWRTFAHLIKTSPKSDNIVLIVTFVFTVVFDLVVAIGVGLALACVLFMKRMSEVTDVHGWVYLDEENRTADNADNLHFKNVPKGVQVFEITGPMFFAATEKFGNVLFDKSTKVLIIRMRSVPAIDATGIQAIEKIIARCKKNGTKVIFSHVNEQPMKIFKKSGIFEELGEEAFCANIDDALAESEELIKNR